MSLSDTEIERYARHIVLREIGGPGQAKLRAAKILSIGAGGLGSPLLLYLAAAGVGTLGVIDDDAVSLSNLQRQILHATQSVGTLKTDSARVALAQINPEISITTHPARLNAENAGATLTGYDLICDGSDNFATRHLVNETCVRLGIPLIAGAIGQWDGQLSVYAPRHGGPCYACVFPEVPAEGLAPNCAEGGVVGALPGVVGSMMAMEAIKWITGAGEPLLGRLWLYDALDAETRVMKVKRNRDCAVCGGTE